MQSPYGEEEVVAAPALELDAVICHLNRSDDKGNAGFLGPDLYFDDLFLRAAPTNRFISVDKVVPTAELLAEAALEERLRVSRLMVDGVVERWAGPLHRVRARLRTRWSVPVPQRASAASPEAFDAFREEWLDVTEEEYQRKVAALSDSATVPA